jgi:ABC-type transporter MlaC component
MSKTALILATLLPALALAALPEDGKKRTEAFIDRLLAVKSTDKGVLPKADQDANQKVFAELDGFFDWDYLMSEPVKPRIDKFSPAEKDEFTKKFKEVLRLAAYPDSGSFFRTAKYKVNVGTETAPDKVTVSIDAKKGDIETKVDIHYKKVGDVLKLYDVSFDGDSLVKDYQNQMVRIIDKGGAKDLIAKIDKRKAELEKPKK